MNHDVIHFYLANGHYGCFSNFSRHRVFLKGKSWPTSEHYFQAQKFPHTEHEEHIRLAGKPMIAANMGRDRSRPLRQDWEDVKDDIMREVVIAKFTQNKALTSTLLDPGDATIVEHTTNDRYWADGSGKNMLGIILMEVRNAIRKGKTRYETGHFV